MRTLRTPRLLAVVAVVGLLAAACTGNDSDDGAASADDRPTTTVEAPEQTIVDVAAGEPDFSSLVDAVKTAGLAETLGGEGPFTVFAPTNEAFAAVPQDQLRAILADREQLTALLTYHVLPAKVMASDLQPTQTVPTVEGDTVDIQVNGSSATINGCNIVETDVTASNGVIHIIDCVLVPPAQ
jgi:uncharacterized surface protein with fasciclin (FAS1) repeats